MLDAAARVFYRRGYSDASVQDVADELGTLKGSHDLEWLTEERRKAIVARRREHEKWVVARIEEAQADGLADPDLDPKITARCSFATIMWTHRWFKKGRDDGEKVASTCAAFALRGMIGQARFAAEADDT